MERPLPFTTFCWLHGAALVLIVSWLLPITAPLWNAFDVAMVKILNGSLEGRPSWQVFWAIANHKAVDVVVAVTLISLTASWWVFADKNVKDERRQKLCFLVAAFIIGDLFCKIFASKMLGLLNFYRMSPSMVLNDFFALPEAVPWLYVKAKSTTSFPGDHSCVFLLWALLFGHFSRGWWAGFSLTLAGFGIFPRVFGATHWATDVVVGSVSLVCITLAWLLASPLTSGLQRATQALNKR